MQPRNFNKYYTSGSDRLTLQCKMLMQEEVSDLVSFLKANPTITMLDVSHNHISAEGAKQLALLPLQRLIISNNPISNKGLFYLLNNKTLIDLDVSHNGIDGEGVCFSNLKKNLIKLNLSFNCLGKKILLSLGKAKYLKYLDISGLQRIHDHCHGMSYFNYASIKEDLNRVARRSEKDQITYLNSIEKTGGSTLLKPFAENQSLETLMIWGNQINDEEVSCFKDTHLKILDLSYNKISEGVLTFKDNKSLKVLNLDNNKINMEDANRCFESNYTLDQLTLRGNLGENNAVTILEKIKNNKERKQLANLLWLLEQGLSNNNSDIFYWSQCDDVMKSIYAFLFALSSTSPFILPSRDRLDWFFTSKNNIIPGIEKTRFIRNENERLKGEAGFLNILKSNGSLPKEDLYFQIMQNVLEKLLILQNKSKIQMELGQLYGYVKMQQNDANHIAAHNLALVLNAIAVTHDNLLRLHDRDNADQLHALRIESIAESGLSSEKLWEIRSSYPSNRKKTEEINTKLLKKVEQILADDSFWKKRGNPAVIQMMNDVLKKDQSNFKKWKAIRNVASLNKSTYEDIKKLCTAILASDLGALQKLAKIASKEMSKYKKVEEEKGELLAELQKIIEHRPIWIRKGTRYEIQPIKDVLKREGQSNSEKWEAIREVAVEPDYIVRYGFIPRSSEPYSPEVIVWLHNAILSKDPKASLQRMAEISWDKLFLAGKYLTDDDIFDLVEFLNKHPEIKLLNVNNNNITDIGVRYLANNKTLTTLYVVGRNKFTDQGAKYFKNNTTLRELDMDHNPNISQAEKLAITKRIQANNYLQPLILPLLQFEIGRADPGSFVSSLDLNLIKQIYAFLFALNTILFPDLDKLFIPIKDIPENRLLRDKMKCLKEEARLLGILRSDDGLPKEDLYIQIIKKLLEKIIMLKANAEIHLKPEMQILLEYIVNQQDNTLHIAAYNLALIIDAMSVAQDNFMRQHEPIMAMQLGVLVKTAVAESGMLMANLKKVETNYPSNGEETEKNHSQLLEQVNLILKHLSFWAGKGNPSEIQVMKDVFKNKLFLLPSNFEKWEAVRKAAQPTSNFLGLLIPLHEESKKLFDAILANDLVSLQELTKTWLDDVKVEEVPKPRGRKGW